MIHLCACLYILGYIQNHFGQNLIKKQIPPGLTIWSYWKSKDPHYIGYNISEVENVTLPEFVELKLFRFNSGDNLYWRGLLGSYDNILFYSEAVGV